MPVAPLPPNEAERLAALARYGVLDVPREEAFDRITRLAAQVLEVPIVAVNLLDDRRQWSKASIGLACNEMPRAESVCNWTILERDVMLVPDARRDPRLADTPLVQSGQIVLYAGAPLITPDGHAIGTLCVADDRPRPFGKEQVETLRLLAGLVMGELELRLRTQELTRARDHAQTLRDLAELINEPLDPRDMTRRALALLYGRMALDWSGLLDLSPDDPSVVTDRMGEGGAGFGVRLRQRLEQRDDPVWAVLRRQKCLFLDGPGVVRAAFSNLQACEVGSAAWVHLNGQQGGQGGPYGLLLARLHSPVPWTPEERALLEAAARSVGVALERADHVQMLESAALTDALTGLGNRRALDEALDEADRRLDGQHLGYVVGMVDLDGMKRVNDERGHASGDDLLREFAGQLGAPGLTAYRLGGDEYALLDLWPADPDEAAQAMHARVVGAERHVQALGYPAGASCGVVIVPREAPNATSALRTADVRMYAHKRERRAARPLP